MLHSWPSTVLFSDTATFLDLIFNTSNSFGSFSRSRSDSVFTSYSHCKSRYIQLSRKLRTNFKLTPNGRILYRRRSRFCEIFVNPVFEYSSDLSLISFCNPNYNIHEDILNCNVTTPLIDFTADELTRKLDFVSGSDSGGGGTDGGGTKQVITSVTSTTAPSAMTSPAYLSSSTSLSGLEGGVRRTTGGNFLDYYHQLERGVVRQENLSLLSNTGGGDDDGGVATGDDTDYGAEERDDLGDLESASGSRPFNSATRSINSPDSTDSGILPDSSSKGTHSLKGDNQPRRRIKHSEASTKSELPPGWEKHEDEMGPYYWHVKTGTIQRAIPKAEDRPLRPLSYCSSDLSSPSTPDLHSFSSLAELEQAFSRASYSIQNTGLSKHLSSSATIFDSAGGTGADTHQPAPSVFSSTSCFTPSSAVVTPSGSGGLRFALRSLGWIPIDEAELVPDRSSKAVNRCIVEMATARRDINDSVGKWGEGKDLYLEMGNHHLVLLDATDLTVLHRQPIITIKIWGVGRDNDRDFAYVARDRISRRFLCHVFRCDTAARHLANALCAQCRQLMSERRQKRPSHLPGMSRHSGGISAASGGAVSGPDESRRSANVQSKVLSFPTPMEEPKKAIASTYLGSLVVDGPGGLEVLNEAIEKMYEESPSDTWTQVSVEVAPSTITITDADKPDVLIAECRVRFLSFMGISRMSTKLCGFIVHSAQNSFICHVFKCEPTAGQLCKTIEAACTLRYQKCLDAQNRVEEAGLTMTASSATTPSKSVETRLRHVVSGVQSVVNGVFRRKSQA